MFFSGIPVSPSTSDEWDQLIDSLVGGDLFVQTLTEDEEEPKRATVDKVLQKVNVFDLLDAMLGVNIGQDSSSIWVFFSEAADQEKLKRLTNELKQIAQGVELLSANEEGARWVVLITNPRTKADPDTSGDTEIKANMTGQVATPDTKGIVQ